MQANDIWHWLCAEGVCTHGVVVFIHNFAKPKVQWRWSIATINASNDVLSNQRWWWWIISWIKLLVATDTNLVGLRPKKTVYNITHPSNYSNRRCGQAGLSQCSIWSCDLCLFSDLSQHSVLIKCNIHNISAGNLMYRPSSHHLQMYIIIIPGKKVFYNAICW